MRISWTFLTLREKCPEMEFFSGPYLDTFHAVFLNNYFFMLAAKRKRFNEASITAALFEENVILLNSLEFWTNSKINFTFHVTNETNKIHWMWY